MNEDTLPRRVWVLFSGKVQGVCFRDGIEAKADEDSIYGGVQNLKPPNRRVWAIFEKSYGEVEEMLRWCKKEKVSWLSNVEVGEVIHEADPKEDSVPFKRWRGKPSSGEHIRLRAILLPKDQDPGFLDDIQNAANKLPISVEVRNLNGERKWLGAVFQGPIEAVNKMHEWCLNKAADFEEIEDDIHGDESNFELQE